MKHAQQLALWQAQLQDAPPIEVLRWAAKTFPGQVTLATSLGPEGLVLMHELERSALSIPVFMLDTGRLFEEVYEQLEQVQSRFALKIRLFFPDPLDVEPAVTGRGPNFFRDSIESRRHCCFIRKVKPLKRALAGHEAWITGLRREQSPTREAVQVVAWDEANGLYKINPLWAWSESQVWNHVRDHELPYNPLHDRGYPSIGCAPCTRPIGPGQDPRAGRWWWEAPEHKECGLHIENGKAVRLASLAN